VRDFIRRETLLTLSTAGQIDQIFNTTLSSVICRNSDKVEFAQRYVMKNIGEWNPLLSCKEIDTFDFEPWRAGGMAKVSIDDHQSGVKIIKN
jgi:hypothetical protein